MPIPRSPKAPSPSVALLAGSPGTSESSRAIQACNDFLRIGPGRSLPGLLAQYRKMPPHTAPTESQDTLEAWSKRYGWKGRAATYDSTVSEPRKNTVATAARETGLALAHVRVRKLKRLATFLEAQIYEQGPAGPNGEPGRHHNVWLRDVKQIGNGENVSFVELRRFNGSLIEHYRGTLDDLAKEVGGRQVKPEPPADDQNADEEYAGIRDRLIARLLALTPADGASGVSGAPDGSGGGDPLV